MRNLWFHTGDLAKVDKAGNLFFLRSTKDVIRGRGGNTNGFEVEEKMLRHPDVVVFRRSRYLVSFVVGVRRR